MPSDHTSITRSTAQSVRACKDRRMASIVRGGSAVALRLWRCSALHSANRCLCGGGRALRHFLLPHPTPP
jgi:hypothetical protein